MSYYRATDLDAMDPTVELLKLLRDEVREANARRAHLRAKIAEIEQRLDPRAKKAD